MSIKRCLAPARQRGLTMIELILFIIIVSVGLAGVMSVLNVTVMHSADPIINKQLQAIAESFLEEVSAMPFTYCDPNDPNVLTAASTAGCSIVESSATIPDGETRFGATNPPGPFNNVYNYNGYAQSPVTDVSGDPNSNYTGYAVSIKVVPEALNGIGSVATTSPAARIAVTVTHGSNSLTLEGYRTRYAPNTVQ